MIKVESYSSNWYSKEAKRQFSKGATVNVDLTEMRIFIETADRKSFLFEDKEVDRLVDDFDKSEASSDTSVSFEDWLIVKAKYEW